MQEILEKKGLGKIAAEACQAAGLSAFLDAWKGRNVFERLYQDALDRMRRSAELQKEIFIKNSELFLQALTGFVDPHFKISGLDDLIVDDANGVSVAGVGVKKLQPMSEAKRLKPRHWDAPHAGILEKPNLLSPQNVFQLLESQLPVAPKTGGAERPEGGFKSRVRGSSPRPNSDVDLSVLSIGSYSPGDHGETASRSSMIRSASLPASCCHSSYVGSSPSRPVARPLATRVPGGLADGETLPKLECRGQGRILEADQYNPHNESPLKNRQRSSYSSLSTAVGGGTPLRTSDGWRLTKDSMPLLTVGSLGNIVSSSAEPSSADVHHQSSPTVAKGRLHSGSPQLLARRPESHFVSPGGIPRFLVQSVQGSF